MGPQYLTRWPPSSQVMSKTGEWVHNLAEVPPFKTPLLTPTIFPPSQQELEDLHLERWWASYPLHITCSEVFESGDETLARPDNLQLYLLHIYKPWHCETSTFLHRGPCGKQVESTIDRWTIIYGTPDTWHQASLGSCDTIQFRPFMFNYLLLF